MIELKKELEKFKPVENLDESDEVYNLDEVKDMIDLLSQITKNKEQN